MTKPERLIRNDRKVDRFNLEVENEVQADLFGHYARECAIQKETRDDAKKAYDKAVFKVRLELKTGEYPLPLDKAGKAIKTTKEDIEAIAKMDTVVDKALDKYIKAEGTYRKAEANMNTMDQRRSSLNNLTTLYSKYYYENKDSGNGFTSKSDQISESQTEALNKNRKKKEA